MLTTEQTKDTTGVQRSSGSGMPSRSRKRFELLEECREVILQRLTDVIAQALNPMSDELTAGALRSIRSEQQQALLDAVMLVREQRMEIEGRFRRSFADIFERRLFATNAAASTDGGPSPTELTLVSDDAISDKLNVDRLIGKARSRLDPDEVLGIRARLGALLEREWFEETQHPVSPEAIFEALRSALAELSPRPEVKVALLDAIEPHVSQNLNGIYASVNERLRAHHVLPRIKPQVQAIGGGSRRGGEAPGAAAPAGASPAGATAAEEPWVAGSFGVVQPGGAAAEWVDGAAAAAAVDGYSAIEDPLVALQQAMADASEGRPAGRMHVARMLRNPAMFGVADIPVSPVQPPLVASLTALQRDAGPIDAAAMLPAVVEQVREQGSPLDQITVEIVSMVFDYIYADRRLPDAIKQQLLRLQVVAVKTALLDRSFFARRQHPMRRLIDRISDVGADPDADLAPGAPLIEGLTGVVDRILEEFDADLSLFDEALDAIERFAREEGERRAARLDAVAQEATAREAFAIAQESARAELGRRLDKDSQPFVREFLNRWWTQVLARLRTSRDGEAAEQAWKTGLRTAEYLIWSVAPKQTEEISRLATVLPGLIRGLRQGLELVEIEAGEHAAFFDELLRAHTREIAAAKKRAASSAPPTIPAAPPVAVAMQPDGTVRFVPKPDAAEASPAPTASDELLSSLRRGQRVEMLGDEGPRVFKLAWISPARKLFILTRYPDESLTMQGSELAFLFQRQQARVAPEDSTLDRAIGSVTGDAAVSAAGEPTITMTLQERAEAAT
ncbi:MAG: DUF1631 family protein [Burkholderiaceae bacterium]|jgi:hypothetical protein|nr:DUF1631 family protein [Burkholderiaceae bacterium]